MRFGPDASGAGFLTYSYSSSEEQQLVNLTAQCLGNNPVFCVQKIVDVVKIIDTKQHGFTTRLANGVAHRVCGREGINGVHRRVSDVYTGMYPECPLTSQVSRYFPLNHALGEVQNS